MKRDVDEIAVVYLLWGPLGAAPLETFMSSYARHPAGAAHRLVVLLKGVDSGELRDHATRLAGSLGAQCLPIAPTGLDLESYRGAAERIDAGRLCFLNSASEILGDGWLRHLNDALVRPGVGIAGATASNESLLASVPAPLRPLRQRRHPAFPNPHLRTNGFILERALMRDLDWRPARRKQQAWSLESGGRSLTRQIAARGRQALVVGRDGTCFEQERWAASRTFRSGAQDNLLIADNRTREYDAAGGARRAELARLAWGAAAPPV
ncbi:MAG TPA: hypothetical protein VHX62_01165 [Solirubrobacteraceae bacterium]|nr:hypothetical protein [Solirubrobacteraceae bacterium]